MPEGIDGIEAGSVCPHNVYILKEDIFTNRDAVADTVDRLFRLVNSAELGVISNSSLGPLDITELITARAEIDKQHKDRSTRDIEVAQADAAVNQQRFNG